MQDKNFIKELVAALNKSSINPAELEEAAKKFGSFTRVKFEMLLYKLIVKKRIRGFLISMIDRGISLEPAILLNPMQFYEEQVRPHVQQFDRLFRTAEARAYIVKDLVTTLFVR